MKGLYNVPRIWLYGAAISIYTYFIALVSVAPFVGVMVWILATTDDAGAVERAHLIVSGVGLLVYPIIFGGLFYLAIGRRLKWHDLRRDPKSA